MKYTFKERVISDDELKSLTIFFIIKVFILEIKLIKTLFEISVRHWIKGD